MKYRIEVLSLGETVRVKETNDLKEAKRIYWQTADNTGLFTRAYVDGKPLSQQAAAKLFPCSRRENMARGMDMDARIGHKRGRRAKR